MAETRITLADQTLIWCAVAMTNPFPASDDLEMWGKILAEVRPKITAGNPRLERIATAAAAVASGEPPLDLVHLRAAVADFARWRAGLSRDAMRAKDGDRTP